ncbi:class I SAM-dependent methyltransferase [Nocardia gamkensis]|uniref:S-adenosyl-L-methionine-dependent methyltransferase n=1 Tax=Nocardia gamkensis TaxID=352869 RepID=A0A7X6L1M7_9NOCA|nr:class I SAM-dependent methyltransferase [Nocardia gamkensis]NKY26196.1 class I SAM-dependent methyltransferase [Nocardia gamkensis]NQE69284.1 putative S-adenosyl-L-methionine-dependent methyltransferase YktD [Nocardia gamkensis]
MAHETLTPDSTAVRVALWRALHVLDDPPPHVFDDLTGLRLAAPEEDWRHRPDMDPQTTAPMRAGIVSRARFLEDLLAEQAERGVDQYVVLGAGLDTFAQRRPDLAARFTVFEVDQPGPQAWKRQRLTELGFDIPPWLRLVPVDFEVDAWWRRLIEAGFDPTRPALVASAGVSMYLTRDANIATLRQLSQLAAGSTLATTFLLPLGLVDADEQRLRRFAEEGARRSGTPFLSFFRPEELVKLAEDAGFATARHISSAELTTRYFADRTDGLRPAESEQIVIATT